jgi:hypothetical protein
MIKMYIPGYLSSIARYIEKVNVVPSWITSMGAYLGIDVDEKLHRRKLRSISSLEVEFSNIDSVAMPFGNNAYYIPLNILGKCVPLFYLDPNSVGSKYAVDRHLEEIKEKTPQYLLLPKEWEAISSPSDNKAIINLLFCTYYPAVPKKNRNTLYTPFVAYISSNYYYIKNIENQMLYKRKI